MHNFVGEKVLIKHGDRIFSVFCYARECDTKKYCGMQLREKSAADYVKKQKIIFLGGKSELNTAMVSRIKTFKQSDVLRILESVGSKYAEGASEKARNGEKVEVLLKKRAAVEMNISKNMLLSLAIKGLHKKLRKLNRLIGDNEYDRINQIANR
ncbi:MAG: hypothetical protein RRZ42_07330 [Oscillospiraceae bacterium]